MLIIVSETSWAQSSTKSGHQVGSSWVIERDFAKGNFIHTIFIYLNYALYTLLKADACSWVHFRGLSSWCLWRRATHRCEHSFQGENFLWDFLCCWGCPFPIPPRSSPLLKVSEDGPVLHSFLPKMSPKKKMETESLVDSGFQVIQLGLNLFILKCFYRTIPCSPR